MRDPARSPAYAELSTPVQFAKGVGPQRAELLRRLDIRTVADLLFCFPRDYQESVLVQRVDQLEEGRSASMVGVVEEVDLRNTAAGRNLLGVLIRLDRDYVRAIWFNQPYIRERLRRGTRVRLSGTPRFQGSRWEFAHPRVEPWGSDQPPPAEGPQPIYPLTEGLRQWQMQKMVLAAVKAYASRVEEVLPGAYRREHRLLGIADALQQIHAPADTAQRDEARRRFVYQELFVLQLALALRKQQRAERSRAPALPLTARIDARIRRLFPFQLTAAQEQAVQEVCRDLDRPLPMNRLLHGDVGSGKTVVAEYAMLLAVAHGCQVALMTPTEILAQQHYETVAQDLRSSRVRMALLTGSMTASQREETRARLAAGEIDLVVGTHALQQDQVRFARLALVVIDEQHKFGVRQRAALRQSGEDPHYLVMTATPIPRTISLTLFGDLDVSTLRELPPDRAPLHTYVQDPAGRDAWWEFFRRKLREGRQGYVIAPLIDEQEQGERQGVERLARELAAGPLAGFRLDRLHGRMAADEKRQTMRDFACGKVRVLVATTVVEVGVDVPNATLMTIEDADRLGLAQLHQLRGRVARGRHPGFVCAFVNTPSELARTRLEAFRSTPDGFELAEWDFRHRGPGTPFSLKQHGLPEFRIADLFRDSDCLEEAREDAQTLVASGKLSADPDFAALRRMVERRYGKVLELADVG